ncbi:MAG: hypothetical protein ACOCV2_10040, partial [Persicimonas sp.]
ELYRFDVAVDDHSVYLRDIPELENRSEFFERFNRDERFFAVVQRDELASLNSDVRRRFDQNLPVLDASSSRVMLVSNKLEEGETQENFIADAIIDDEEFTPDIPLEFADGNGEVVHASFDDRIDLVGWTIDRHTDDGTFPSYRWGETATITLYFEVKRRVSSAQEIFMHVDRGGSRLHGDHDPVGGDYPTNRWEPGDIIVDEYELEIESYSTPGVYTIWMGFFRGDRRMQVTPSQADDGQNRVMVGRIDVRGWL